MEHNSTWRPANLGDDAKILGVWGQSPQFKKPPPENLRVPSVTWRYGGPPKLIGKPQWFNGLQVSPKEGAGAQAEPRKDLLKHAVLMALSSWVQSHHCFCRSGCHHPG